MPERLEYGGDTFPPGDREIWEEWYESRGGSSVEPTLDEGVDHDTEYDEFAGLEPVMAAAIESDERQASRAESAREISELLAGGEDPTAFRRTRIGQDIQQAELAAEEHGMSVTLPPKERLLQAREALVECFPPTENDKRAVLPRAQIGDKNGMIL